MNTKPCKHPAIATALALAAGWADYAVADTSLQVSSVSDTYLNSDPTWANRDLSNFGDMEISASLPDPAQGVSYARTMDAVVGYDTSSILAGFNAQYGAGEWHVTDVQVEWYSNYDILGVPANNTQFNVPAAGAFNISLLADNNWFNPATAGGPGLANTDFNWDSVFNAGGAYSNLLVGAQTLGAYNYTGGNFNGTNNCANVSCDPRFWDLGANSALFSAIENGGLVSLFGSAADNNVSYIINQRGASGAQPQLIVYASANSPVAAPLPAAVWSFAGAGLALLAVSRRRRQGAAHE
ncbi:MAG: VPLPA-CTERM sorting domain-containing protein [Methylomonas sp.]|jgi:hypothetical protein